jgi:hypothetical protein
MDKNSPRIISKKNMDKKLKQKLYEYILSKFSHIIF